MDRLSYKDGYLKGIYQTLNILLEDSVISKEQWKNYKDKFFNFPIIVPENYQFLQNNLLTTMIFGGYYLEVMYSFISLPFHLIPTAGYGQRPQALYKYWLSGYSR